MLTLSGTVDRSWAPTQSLRFLRIAGSLPLAQESESPAGCSCYCDAL